MVVMVGMVFKWFFLLCSVVLLQLMDECRLHDVWLNYSEGQMSVFVAFAPLQLEDTTVARNVNAAMLQL